MNTDATNDRGPAERPDGVSRASGPQPASCGSPAAATLTGLERDLLLASSGELGWMRRLRLRRALARDADGRRLAEMLALVELVADDPQPSGRAAVAATPAAALFLRSRIAAAAASLSVVLLGTWMLLTMFGNGDDEASLERPVDPATVSFSEPLSSSSARLLLACRLSARLPRWSAQETAQTPRRFPLPVPLLPGWPAARSRLSQLSPVPEESSR